MQSQIGVDKEDFYTLKINFKGKRTVGKARKGIKVAKTIIDLKNKIKKKRKKEKDENSTELQKPNTEAEVNDNNKNCD